MNNEPTAFKAGMIAIVGAPNAGKSTLLNRLLGEKLSITSKKPQTTRNRILGVCHRPGAQLVFFDTPGVHRTEKLFNRRIVDVAFSSVADADLVLLIVDAAKPDPAAETYMVQKLASQSKPVILALNKTDLAGRDHILATIDIWAGRYPFDAVVPISAKQGLQTDVLLRVMEERLPEGFPYFPEDAFTDVPTRFIVAELIREKVFRMTGEEIPYASAVTIDQFDESDGKKTVRIHATIHVERDSQKGIVIGKGGQKLRQIGEASRKDIEALLDRRVFLKLFIRVQKNWSRDTRSLRKFGY
ncbi:MAG: GTPase Era [Desulfobacterales bacterium]|jgi:GTP-binding protein Era